jgi:hypothetical protein
MSGHESSPDVVAFGVKGVLPAEKDEIRVSDFHSNVSVWMRAAYLGLSITGSS